MLRATTVDLIYVVRAPQKKTNHKDRRLSELVLGVSVLTRPSRIPHLDVMQITPCFFSSCRSNFKKKWLRMIPKL